MARPIESNNYLLATGILSLDGALHALGGAAAASTAAVQTPIGALFGGTYFAVSHLAHYGFHLLEGSSIYPIDPKGTISKVCKLAFSLITGISAAVLVLSLIPLPLVFSTGALLTTYMLGTTGLIAALMTGSHHLKNVAIGPKFFLP